eukprot:10662445-Alexandrium_andersonii.AAC.1
MSLARPGMAHHGALLGAASPMRAIAPNEALGQGSPQGPRRPSGRPSKCGRARGYRGGSLRSQCLTRRQWRAGSWCSRPSPASGHAFSLSLSL